MDALFIEQSHVMGSISRALDNLKKLGKNNYTVAILRNRSKILEDNWHECKRLNYSIEAGATPEQRTSHEYFTNGSFLQLEAIYEASSDYLATWIDKLTKPVAMPGGNTPQSDTSVVEHHHTSIQLPRIPLIQFSGDYTTWSQFKDVFESLVVNNESLTNVQRLHYLKASLIEEASLVLKNVTITEANYQAAWDLLIKRYENQRVIINAHLQSFVTLPCMNSGSVKELRSLLDTTNDAITALKNIKRPVEHWDDLIVFIIVQKLDTVTRREWEFKQGDTMINPTFKELDAFLSARIRALEAKPSESKTNSKSERSKPSKHTAVNSHQTNTVTYKCIMCKENHLLYQCKTFKDKTVEQRTEFLKAHKRCFNCLNSGHYPTTCTSKYVCKTCRGKHHTLLHRDNANTVRSSNEQPEHNNSNPRNSPEISSHFAKPEVASNSAGCRDIQTTLLPTAFVVLRSESGRQMNVRALLDQGSQSTFISESVAQILRAKRTRLSVTVSGLGGAPMGCVRSAIAVTLVPPDPQYPEIPVSALILPKLTSYLPKPSDIRGSWAHIRSLNLADPDPTGPTPIELLIGADLYGRILLNGVLQGPAESPTAQYTIFGWVVSGAVNDNNSDNKARDLVVHHQVTNECLHDSLRSYWELEEVPAQAMLTEAENCCDSHFSRTHSRDLKGVYTVRLPFKTEPPIPIGQSKGIVEHMFYRTESRLHQKPELARSYREFMEEYATLNHMEKVASSADAPPSGQAVYFPHYPVVKATSQTTRVRVVFNASCSTSNGTSLNDFLHIGPKLQADLFSLILRWRTHPYVYTADIEKMFRQIKIHPDDVDYQRILWRVHPKAELSAFRLLTVTYGTACAPYLANRVLKQLAKDEGSEFPLAVSILENCVYVDDVMFGAEDIVLAKQKRNQITHLLKAGGFNLRRWAGNSKSLLNDIPVENHGLATDKTLKLDENLKVLGIAWNPLTDSFRFQTEIKPVLSFTKRAFLAMASRVFNPLGWASPFAITAKILLQTFWIRKIEWDETLPEDLAQRCLTYYEQLPLLQKLVIPRWTGQANEPQKYELHGFADASTVAYAAVVYLRVETLAHATQLTLLLAKTKVAPIKVQSIPRLELCAAVLLSRLMEFAQSTMSLQKAPVFCWSDSSVVLAWLDCHPSKWKTFVANRVSEIKTRLPSAQWKHVPSTSNPADCASRGISAEELATKRLWWQGPPWLLSSPESWPNAIIPKTLEHKTELRSDTHAHAGTNIGNQNWTLPYEVSSWHRLLRVTAYVLRFVAYLRNKPRQEGGISLTAGEVNAARQFWIKSVQAEHFPQELLALKTKRAIAPKSPLCKLNPTLDSENIMRLGGRLRHSTLSRDERFPVILPKHRVSDLLIQHIHRQTLHGGVQLMLRTLREQYWVICARYSVKACIHACIRCVRERATVPSQLMGDVPAVRVTPARPFSHTGIDYAGPLLVRVAPGRGHRIQKCYIALFVCLTIRAIHLELVADCSTAEFLAAFDRFAARRGLPSDVYSDNGTNFQGADKELAKQFEATMNDPDVRNHLANDQISWHFIPPSAPHFGGVWEAGVKSVKHHLRRVVGAFTPTKDELNTLLAKIESCLNSQPIAPLHDDPDSTDALTPGHFLVGSHLKYVPIPSILAVNENRLSRWQSVQQIAERFWKIWSSDYLNSLQQRPKWRAVRHDIQPNDFVLLRNPNLPPCKWDLGRVSERHPGTDNLTRVVTVKTSKSTYKCPITQLCKLPI